MGIHHWLRFNYKCSFLYISCEKTEVGFLFQTRNFLFIYVFQWTMPPRKKMWNTACQHLRPFVTPWLIEVLHTKSIEPSPQYFTIFTWREFTYIDNSSQTLISNNTTNSILSMAITITTSIESPVLVLGIR